MAYGSILQNSVLDVFLGYFLLGRATIFCVYDIISHAADKCEHYSNTSRLRAFSRVQSLGQLRPKGIHHSLLLLPSRRVIGMNEFQANCMKTLKNRIV